MMTVRYSNSFGSGMIPIILAVYCRLFPSETIGAGKANMMIDRFLRGLTISPMTVRVSYIAIVTKAVKGERWFTMVTNRTVTVKNGGAR